MFDWDGIGSFPSIPETVAIWAELNPCIGDPTIEWLPDIADDSTRVWTETHDNCAGGAEVKLYGVEGGGHTWPGGPGPLSPRVGYLSRDISASAEIVEFFSRHSLDQ
ncbi:MAG: hypothetical protein AMS25_09170 [Gemmatimonas sp. SM23_52]|nr:MAG: hypothetical protein AMS25_09170 [Gemmatimonas sp. SM23_52]